MRPYSDFLSTRLDRLDVQLAINPDRPDELTELEDR
jgi:hypothetical protein